MKRAFFLIFSLFFMMGADGLPPKAESMAKAKKMAFKESVKCAQGDAEACVSMGDRYLTGRGIGYDRSQARFVYDKACRAGSQRGCVLQSAMLLDSARLRDNRKALKLLQTACDSGDQFGCTWLGVMHTDARIVPRDVAKGMELFTAACDAGEAYGCLRMGEHSDSPEAAATAYETGCALSGEQACVRWGDALFEGTGTAQDYDRASALVYAWCIGGSWQACYAGGLHLKEARDREKVIEFACVNEGLCTVFGEHIEQGLYPFVQHRGRAQTAYRADCDQRSFRACNLLGDSLRRAPDDWSEAAEVYGGNCKANKANCSGSRCSEEIAASCTSLAGMYWSGVGVEKDYDKGAELYGRACEGMDDQGCAKHGYHLVHTAKGKADQLTEGLKHLRDTCLAGVSWACTAVADLREGRLGIEADPADAVVMLTKGCKAGDRDSCRGLVTSEARGMPGAEYETVLDIIDDACNRDEGSACATLADLVLHRDAEKSAAALARACELEDFEACLSLGDAQGLAIADGRCDSSDSRCSARAWMAQSGCGVKKDAKSATDLYTRACVAGSTGACAAKAELEGDVPGLREHCNVQTLAGCSALGASAAKGDRSAGIAVWRDACEHGDGESCVSLAEGLASGDGVAADLEEAAHIFERACAGNRPHRCDEMLVDTDSALRACAGLEALKVAAEAAPAAESEPAEDEAEEAKPE